MSSTLEDAQKLLQDLKTIGDFDVHSPYMRRLAELVVALAEQQEAAPKSGFDQQLESLMSNLTKS